MVRLRLRQIPRDEINEQRWGLVLVTGVSTGRTTKMEPCVLEYKEFSNDPWREVEIDVLVTDEPTNI